MIHVLLNDELLAEWQVRYAGANRAIAAGQVAYVSFAHLNTRRVLAGDSDCVGSMSIPLVCQPTAAPSTRIVPDPQQGSRRVPPGFPASRIMAAATVGRK